MSHYLLDYLLKVGTTLTTLAGLLGPAYLVYRVRNRANANSKTADENSAKAVERDDLRDDRIVSLDEWRAYNGAMLDRAVAAEHRAADAEQRAEEAITSSAACREEVGRLRGLLDEMTSKLETAEAKIRDLQQGAASAG